MSAAVAAILGGMPEPRDLRMHQPGDRCVISAGSVVLFDYDAGDTAMRNIALATLRQLGFKGRTVAAALGLTENYVSTLHNAAMRDGSAALTGQPRPGRPGTVTAAQWEQARELRARDASDAEIGRQLGVAHTTISRRLGPRGQTAGGGEPGRAPAEPLFTEPAADAEPVAGADAEPTAEVQAEPAASPEPEAEADAGWPGAGRPGGEPSWPLVPEGVFRSRYAGAMLLHGFFARAGAGTVLARAGGQAAEPGDAAVLAAVSMCFALGAATTEQFKHLTAAEAGPLAGLGTLPGLRTLRPRLAQIADGSDPLAVQRLFASAMLTADPVMSGVYYVDDHFVPYTGAKPVAKGWNNKRSRAERGRADTHVTTHDGRAVCFVTGE